MTFFKMYVMNGRIPRRELESTAEKRGKHHWANRFLRLYGERLFIFRQPVDTSGRREGKLEFPINILELSCMLVERESPQTIRIVTHRNVGSSCNLHRSTNSDSTAQHKRINGTRH